MEVGSCPQIKQLILMGKKPCFSAAIDVG